MTLSDYDKATKQLTDEAVRIEQAKRPAYTMGSPDVLANFKNVAQRLDLTPMQAWGVYFLKHIDAITAAAKDPTIPQGEAILGRFADAINYLKLGWALVSETSLPLTVDFCWESEKKEKTLHSRKPLSHKQRSLDS